MSAIIFSILSFILLYKYVALFLIAYFAALLIPLPSNTTLIAAAAFASQGYLNIFIVILVALVANVLGDISGFVISRKYGKGVLMKIGFRKILFSRTYERLEKIIVNNSKPTIFITRFFGGIGPLVNILTGLSKEIPIKTFLVFGITGELVYVLSLSLPGYFLGSEWEILLSPFEDVNGLIIIAIIILLISLVYSSRKKRITK